MFGNLPLSPLIDLANAILCFFCGLKLAQALRREPSDAVVRSFRNAYFALVGAYVFFSLPRLLFPYDSANLAIAFWIAHLFLFTATGFFARVTALLVVPRRVRAIVTAYAVLAAAALVLGVVSPSYPTVDVLSGATSWNVSPDFGVAGSIVILLVLVPSAVYFGWQAMRTKDAPVRRRSVFITVGILFLIAAVGTFYQATTVVSSLVSDLFSLVAFLAVFLAVFPHHGVGTSKDRVPADGRLSNRP